jgi:hypothetical protein
MKRKSKETAKEKSNENQKKEQQKNQKKKKKPLVPVGGKNRYERLKVRKEFPKISLVPVAVTNRY